VEAHLAVCAGCRELLEDLQASQAAVKELGAEPVDGALLTAVRAGVQAKIDDRGKRVWPWVAAAATALALLAIFRAPSPPPAPKARPVTIAQVPKDSGGAAPLVSVRRPRRAPRSRMRPAKGPAPPLVVKMLTDDPNIVIICSSIRLEIENEKACHSTTVHRDGQSLGPGRDNPGLPAKYVSPQSLGNLLGPFGNMRISPVEQLKAITVRANPAMLAEVEKLVQRFDVPPPPVQNIDITIYLMSALGQPAAGAVPPELEGVVKQLKSTFSYKGFQLIDTQVIRVRAGQGGEASGVVEGQSVDGNKAINQVKFRSASVSTDEKGRAIRIDGLKVGIKIPVVSGGAGAGPKQYQYLDTGINTDVDVREGQKWWSARPTWTGRIEPRSWC